MSELHPIDSSLTPFTVGEKVAFTEGHPTHPGMYGVVTQIGTDEAGSLTFDLAVHNPFTGVTSEDTTFRATIGDIQ
jgi:hypothetical protein